MTEQALNTKLRDYFKQHGADFCRIENGAGAGMPDINICLLGMEAWVESKLDMDRKGVFLRKEQYAWGVRRANAGGTVVVVAWDDRNLHYLLWQYDTNLRTEPVGNAGKYVRIISEPARVTHLDQVKKFLFPSI